jgi:hypothetical protein
LSEYVKELSAKHTDYVYINHIRNHYETGSVLKEIVTGRLFEVGKRLKNDSQLWGDDPWEITEITPGDRIWKTIGYLELTEKYHAEVENNSPEH